MGLLFGMFAAACDDPTPPAVPSPDPSLMLATSLVWMSTGNWDMEADIHFTVRAYSYARKATELTLTGATLFAHGDLTTPLATLDLALGRTSLAFTDADYEDVRLANAGTLNRRLAGACGSVDVVLTFHSSSCDCEVTASGPLFVDCLPDNGADPELALVGEPAPAGRPCGQRSYTTSGGVEELDGEKTFRYDAQGRVLFADSYDAAHTWLDRTTYTYAAGALLAERDVIRPLSRDVQSRWTYAYTTGSVTSIERDGDIHAPPDGIADHVWTYALGGTPWTETESGQTTTYTYDSSAHTISTNEGDTFFLAEPLSDPSLWFATIPLVDSPQVLHSEHTQDGATITVTYTYDGQMLLEARSSDLYGWASREELLYTCP